jgi:sodium/proline symporter
MHIGLILSFVVYLAILLLIGVLSYRRSVNSTDYILGGRSLNYWVTAISAHASDMSSWLFLAYPATVFLFGGWQVWTAVGLIIGMYLNWQFIAPRLRTETEKYGSMTLSHYFENRFQDKTGILRTISAAPLLLFFAVYVSSGLVGMGYLFETVFDINYTVGISAALCVIILYVFVGGFATICWIDLFQGLFLLAMIILVPMYTFSLVGGAEGISSAVAERGLSLSIFPQGTHPLSSFMQILLLSLGWGLGYFGQPHILSKFMGIRHVSEMHKSKYVGISWQILSMAAATFVGIIAIAYFRNGIESPQFAFVLIVKQLFHPFVAGMILCGILAATISTMDSQILILASVLSEDFYHRFFRKKSSQKEIVWTSRIAVVIIAIIAYMIAISTESTINALVQYGWSGLGSTFGSVLVLSLYSKRVNLIGAVTGIVFGGTVAAVWPYFNAMMPVNIPSLIPGFLLNMLIIYVVSILTTPSNKPYTMRTSHE